MLAQDKEVIASAIPDPICFVKAEVISVGSEMRKLDSGRVYESFYINLKIIEVTQGDSSVITAGQIYRAIDNCPGTFKKGETIRAGIAFASSMGLSGPVSFLQWSPVTYENGSPIRGNNNVIIDFLQSDAESLNPVFP